MTSPDKSRRPVVEIAELDACRGLRDAIDIWQAGTEAVTPRRLFADKVRFESQSLWVEDNEYRLDGIRRLIVVGAGKAAAAMAEAFHAQFAQWSRTQPGPAPQCVGWVNCPEGSIDLQKDTGEVRRFVARPQGRNEPTQAAIDGTQQILNWVRGANSDDLVICLLSGGGSALLVAPPPGVSLADKQQVARMMSAAGASIDQMNTVRRCLSLVKGGGLAQACKQSRLVTLVISDVLGDPLETIASGPTVEMNPAQPREALAVLESLKLSDASELQNIHRYLNANASERDASRSASSARGGDTVRDIVVLGNNADAVDAAGAKAVELGYRYVMQAAQASEGDVNEVAELAAHACAMLGSQAGVDCWISGGEPTVRLPEPHGRGGRNQQLALATMLELVNRGWPSRDAFPEELSIVCGGTDGEDGPTKAAGAVVSEAVWQRAIELNLDPVEYLANADAYSFFEQVGGLLVTGPTGTNVCDLRVAVARKVTRPDEC